MAVIYSLRCMISTRCDRKALNAHYWCVIRNDSNRMLLTAKLAHNNNYNNNNVEVRENCIA